MLEMSRVSKAIKLREKVYYFFIKDFATASISDEVDVNIIKSHELRQFWEER